VTAFIKNCLSNEVPTPLIFTAQLVSDPADWNDGSAPDPFDVKTYPAVPFGIEATGDVPSPTKTSWAGSVLSPVPPFATGRTPVMSTEALILLNIGAAAAPLTGPAKNVFAACGASAIVTGPGRAVV
jgi:hypothetical protein